MTDHVQTETVGGVLTVRINRPDKRNAITQDMYQALGDALVGAEADESVRVVVFTGSGGAFTAGNELADIAERDVLEPSGPTARFIRALIDTSKVLVAEVDGAAIGIGTTMLLHCDLVYATARSKFGMPFVNLGVVPEAASSVLLPRIAGPGRAARLLLFGDVFSAAEAAEAGIVTEVVADAETLRAKVADRVEALLARPAGALAAVRQLLHPRALVAELHTAAALEGEVFTAASKTPEAQAAIARLTKR
ncbi:enoyl-CoA hydratase/isomerase family protein [Frankia sp. CNm7]|uniref:Enoyl-CoA hydratase/isomerase family protein n=1 Tax=Frankia nepalensis TaxID=1836974 RepID=A0A937REX5_9ACTN|nr:enoyl-CoA hydratase-related protein [Frankia nepalensis]MBL7498516.1 enoyl-CoA hydratase/isomerase family protein [Frankia nepalensis]MBL7513979.1 enoyl-CoA hydratase/isomerase family protein [Frankia nepalensis]MBL7523231.1 enoyl-CoA hydratase/isomerase family protein [Frankia nepalensis]MBL7630873.1 enoyl-CoA hydratase/isomerase family protein [Frankia nepalensis]